LYSHVAVRAGNIKYTLLEFRSSIFVVSPLIIPYDGYVLHDIYYIKFHSELTDTVFNIVINTYIAYTHYTPTVYPYASYASLGVSLFLRLKKCIMVLTLVIIAGVCCLKSK